MSEQQPQQLQQLLSESLKFSFIGQYQEGEISNSIDEEVELLCNPSDLIKLNSELQKAQMAIIKLKGQLFEQENQRRETEVTEKFTKEQNLLVVEGLNSELLTLKQQVDLLNQVLLDSKEQSTKAIEETSQAREEVAIAKLETALAKEKIALAQIETAKVQQMVVSAEIEIEKVNYEAKNVRDEASKAQKEKIQLSLQLSDISAEKAKIEVANRKLENEMMNLAQEYRSLKEELSAMKSQAEHSAQQFSQEKLVLEKSLVDLATQIKSQTTLLNASIDSEAVLKQQLAQATQQSSSLSTQLQSKITEISTLTQNIAAEKATLIEKVQQYEIEFQRLEEVAEQARQHNEQSKKNLEQSMIRKMNVNQQVPNPPAQLPNNNIMNSSIASINDVLQELSSCKQQLLTYEDLFKNLDIEIFMNSLFHRIEEKVQASDDLNKGHLRKNITAKEIVDILKAIQLFLGQLAIKMEFAITS